MAADVYEKIRHELYHYGTNRISGACNKQRPVQLGKCYVQTICDGITVNEPVMNASCASGFVKKIMCNYPLSDFIVRLNKRASDILYYATVINLTTRHEELSIKIISQ